MKLANYPSQLWLKEIFRLERGVNFLLNLKLLSALKFTAPIRQLTLIFMNNKRKQLHQLLGFTWFELMLLQG